MKRRELIKDLGAIAGLAACTGVFAGPRLLAALTSRATPPFPVFDVDSGDPWSQLPTILARIKWPVFPARDFDVTKFGAIGDNKTDCTQAFEKAIAACHAAKGGRVVVPAGEFVTGAIHLKSNVNLHVSLGGTVRFTHDSTRYPLVFTRWEGIELMNFSPFIYAFEQENIAITGQGTIAVNADCEHWWPWNGGTKGG